MNDTIAAVAEQTTYFTWGALGTASYWIGAVIVVLLTLFIKEYIYFTPQYGDWDDGEEAHGASNFIVIVFCTLAFVPVFKWIVLVAYLFAFMYAIVNDMIHFDEEKFFANKTLNFLFSHKYKTHKEQTNDKKDGLNEL